MRPSIFSVRSGWPWSANCTSLQYWIWTWHRLLLSCKGFRDHNSLFWHSSESTTSPVDQSWVV